jgi:IclR family transcriptional regulator, KDG regulon repressor
MFYQRSNILSNMVKNVRKCYRVPAVEHALDILDLIRGSAYGRTTTELSKVLRIPYSTTFSLLQVLEMRGFVRRDTDTKKFYSGARLMNSLGGSSEGSDVIIRDTASPYMTELVTKTGLTSHLAIRVGEEAIYIDRRESNGFLKINSWIGQHVPLHCTAVGKSLLLHLTSEDIVEVFKRPILPRFTDRTITTVSSLIKHLQKYRTLGYTVDERECELEGVCVAAPIVSTQGRVAAAIGVSGTIYQTPPKTLPEVGEEIRQMADEISKRLGFKKELSLREKFEDAGFLGRTISDPRAL